MIPFFSRRNQVYPVLWQGRRAVEKHFVSPEDWSRETELYMLLQGVLPLPKVLEQRPGCLTLEFCPAPTLLDVLEEQEAFGFSPLPWQTLAAWLGQCHSLCGRLPLDGNLRNFLWDGQQILGLDLESFRTAVPSECGAGVIAALLGYEPAGSLAKERAAALLAAEMGVSNSAIAAAQEALTLRRQEKTSRAFSGIILAGGNSRRMGRCKAELPLLGRSLLQWQAEKLRHLGIRDILISGESWLSLPGARTIPDILPGRGPLGGLHACLREAESPQCLVLSVDAPLVPVNTLSQLCHSYRHGAVILRHGDREEPLIGVYPSGLSERIPPLIRDGGASVRKLKAVCPWDFFDYLGPEEYLRNCNTPQDFQAVERLLVSCVENDLPLCF